MLKVALPKGTLEQDTMRLFEDANLKVVRQSPRQHDAEINHPDISQVKIMRPQHIPSLVANGTYDIGICGWDCVLESGNHNIVSIESRFSYKPTKVVLVTAEDSTILKLFDIEENMTILSEYPDFTRRFLGGQGVRPNIRFSYGGTEAHIPEDYPLGVCVTATGESLRANGLKIIATLFESKTVMIANPRAKEDCTKKDAIHSLKLMLDGVVEAREQVLLVMNVVASKKARILREMTALKRPTVSRLAGGKYFSISGVVKRQDTNELIPKLLRNGAEDLVEIPISKVIRSW